MSCDPARLQRTEAGVVVRGIRHVLLDIEGTTCPVSFVAGTLFPYAARAMGEFLARETPAREEVRQLLEAVRQAWRQDADREAQALLAHHPEDPVVYLRWLIEKDRKLPALKELQGLVWRAGYGSGELVAPLFDDVAEYLRCWRQQGLGLAVYSSGSVIAQQLLYQHSSAGDLSGLFQHWFDTRTGPKQDSSSYRTIASTLESEAQQVLFISDSAAECRAAQAAGMAVLFSDREGNPQRDPQEFTPIKSFDEVSFGSENVNG